MKRITFLLVVTLFSYTYLQAQIVITNDNTFKTADQMLLANELFESGEPWAEALGYNLDDLDPLIPNSPDAFSYHTGIESYEYSRYLLNTLNGRSGLGLHMMWSPIIMENAAMQATSFDGQFTGGTANGFKEDDMLMMMIGNFGANANFVPFENPFPQFADFLEGDNNLPQTVQANFEHNFGSTRWDRSLMDKTLNLGAMGQSTFKQYLWAQDMLSAFHNSADEGIDADGTNSPDLPGSSMFDPNNNIFYGGNNADGFIGQILTAESINKTKFLLTQLAYDGTNLGMVDPATYDPTNGIKYFPTKITVTETATATGLPPKWDTFTVTDPMSKIFDQWSYLLATTNYMNMMEPNNTSDAAHLAFREVFDGFPFSASMQETGTPGPYDLMKGTSKVIFMNMMAMHFNTTNGTFIDGVMLNGAGMPMMDNMVKSLNAGYVLVALENFIPQFTETPLETMATNALNAQANFIINNLKDPNGGFYNMYTIGTGADTSTKTLTANSAIIIGLYAAYNATGNNTYLTEANNGYNYLISNFYNTTDHVFKTEEGNNTATYTPKNLGVLAGVLREANLVGNQTNAKTIYTDIFNTIYNKMILREAEVTGETGSDSDSDGIPYIVGGTKPFVFAAEATFDMSTASVSNIAINNLNIYPNPVENSIQFGANLNNIKSYVIFNLLGQEIDKGNIENNKIQVETLKKGIYLIKIDAGKKQFTGRFIKS
ncbi:MAG TPA: T9SS type A sorting domain-containing protein [Crocinitomix sp.]|nr:T9SS type A sorting domain-containing protein [Crocinitomix sp.]